MTKRLNKKEIFWLFLIGCTIIFLTVFNLYKMDDFSVPDSEVEKVFARTMWREKSLFPETWYSTTEPLNLRPTVFTAIFWGILKDMCIAHSATLAIMMICSCFATYYMFSGLKNARKQKLEIQRFAVRFPKRLYGESKWNTGRKAKWKFIKRTLEFSVRLKKGGIR